MDYLPVFLDVRDRSCIVVGGNPSATRKAELLLRAGARVLIVADALDALLSQYVDAGRIKQVREPLQECHLAGCFLVVVALDDERGAERAAQIAAARGIPVNVVDRPALCSFIMPAIVDRSPVQIAISTAGTVPVLGRLLRARLEALLPARLGELARLAGQMRAEVVRRLPPARRRQFWEAALQGPIAELVYAGEVARARERLRAQLSDPAGRAGAQIYLIALPPGADPELFTLRALRLLQQADVIFHDRGLAQPLLDMFRRDAERRPVPPVVDEQLVDELAGVSRQGQRAAWLTSRHILESEPASELVARLKGDGAAVQVMR